MGYFPTRVETKDHIARWKIDRGYRLFDSSIKQLPFSAEIWKYSDVFKIGNWEWQLSLCKPYVNAALLIGLDPIVDEEDPSPIMYFTITVACSKNIHNTIVQVVPGRELRGESIMKLYKRDNVMCLMGDYFIGKFTIIVTFSNFMKTTNPWAEKPNKKGSQGLVPSVGKMLSENIFSDVTINTKDGVKFGAHRAILASRSPVFHSMFSHDLQEKELSTINITDMSTKACQVFFKYIYGNMEHEDLVEHRFELLGAADKYDVSQLKEACVESFIEDINQKNIIEMLQTADIYQLTKLKSKCMEFLVKSGNVFEIQDEFDKLLQVGDRDLIVELFREILKEWKSCKDEIDIDT